MSSTAFIKNLYSKCRMHGSGEAQVVISDGELLSLIYIALKDLKWSITELNLPELNLPELKLPYDEYFTIPLSWFQAQEEKSVIPKDMLCILERCFIKNNDFALFIENLSALHRRRIKYRKILSYQPMPTMDQIGPRVLLEYGNCENSLLANWMMWRKWIYDIDNRSAQETGYLFEPLLASCLGGEPIGSRNSPVKRLDGEGKPTSKGRQIDCLVPTSNRTYELKLRVTIAASGQGRFGEELSFPVESQAAGFTPVLLVLDPTPSDRLTELSKKFKECGGEFYHGEDAWNHMEEESGTVVSVFIDKYIKPAIQAIEEVSIPTLQSINLKWTKEEIQVKNDNDTYIIGRM